MSTIQGIPVETLEDIFNKRVALLTLSEIRQIQQRQTENYTLWLQAAEIFATGFDQKIKELNAKNLRNETSIANRDLQVQEFQQRVKMLETAAEGFREELCGNKATEEQELAMQVAELFLKENLDAGMATLEAHAA